MAARPRRIELEQGTDLLKLIDDIRADGQARVLERDGEPLVVVLPADEYGELAGEPKSKRNKDKLISLAGAWADIDADDLIGRIYAARHESPTSSTPVLRS